MDIKQAKEQVKKSCIAYLTKDEFGDYVVPVETQRSIFLVGAPGIGKTAIMAQVADELELGLVNYSMTHHTRQPSSSRSRSSLAMRAFRRASSEV